jgi:hypothetical protein
VVVGDEAIFVEGIPVRRLRCPDCGARYAQAPEGVPSRGHHQPSVVARAVAEVGNDPHARVAVVARDHGCHRRTLGRWVVHIAALVDPGVLARMVMDAATTPVLPKLPEPRSSRSARWAALVARAAAVLALLEVLGSLRGLEPPALTHAASLVPVVAPPDGGGGGASSGA